MLGFLVFGTLTAVLVAELYVMMKKEEALEKEEHKHECNCGCCHHEEDNEIDMIIDSQGRKCGHGMCNCCHKEDEEE